MAHHNVAGTCIQTPGTLSTGTLSPSNTIESRPTQLYPSVAVLPPSPCRLLHYYFLPVETFLRSRADRRCCVTSLCDPIRCDKRANSLDKLTNRATLCRETRTYPASISAAPEGRALLRTQSVLTRPRVGHRQWCCTNECKIIMHPERRGGMSGRPT